MVFLLTQPIVFPLTGTIAELLTGTMVKVLAFCSSEEVGEIRTENEALKQLVAELSLDIRVLKKTLTGLE